MADQRHIIVRKKLPQDPPKKEPKVDATTEEKLNQQFRSFAVLEDTQPSKAPGKGKDRKKPESKLTPEPILTDETDEEEPQVRMPMVGARL